MKQVFLPAVITGLAAFSGSAHALSIGVGDTATFAYNYETNTEGEPVFISSPYTGAFFSGNFFSYADDYDNGDILQSDEDLVFKLYNDEGEQWFEGSVRDRIGTADYEGGEGFGTAPSNFSIGFTENDNPWDGFLDPSKSSQIGTLELTVVGLYGEADPYVNLTEFGMDFWGTTPTGSTRSTEFREEGSFYGLTEINPSVDPGDPVIPPTITPVPLPATAMSLLLGLGLLGGVRRYRTA